MRADWLWDRKISISKAKRILKDPQNDEFAPLAALLLARKNEPKAVFKEYVDPLTFCRYWAKLKKQMRQDKWNEPRIIFWQAIYEKLAEKFRKKNITISIKEKKAVKNELYVKTGKKIIGFRKEQGLSQKDLAKKMGVSQQLISRIESGNENASLETLSNIAKVFNKEVDVTFI